MPYLVVSYTHLLIPFAYRLKLEGNQTQLVVCSPPFEKAWNGKFDHVLPAREVNAENLKPTLEMAQRGEVTVLSDSNKTSRMFRGVPSFYGVLPTKRKDRPQSLLRLGAWWNGEEFTNHHFLVCDLGAWPGGYGPQVLGGLTLLRASPEHIPVFEPVLNPLVETIVNDQFQGLVQAGVQENALGGLELSGAEFGWPFLQSHAFLSELDSFADLLEKREVELPKKSVTVVPVSLPPWPAQHGAQRAKSASDRPVAGLTPKQMGSVFWHDVHLDAETKTVSSGGLDGLLGVARGAADNHYLSRSKAVKIASMIEAHEKQMRPDAGGMVANVLAQLEDRMGVVV
jgi:hypothetical protein